VQIIDIESYKNILRPELLKNKKVSGKEIEFLDWLTKRDALEKEYLLQSMWEYNYGGEISDWIKTLIPEKYIKTITRTDHFQSHLLEGLKGTDLEILENGYHLEVKFDRVTEDRIQKIGSNVRVFKHNGLREYYTDPGLPKGFLRTVAEVHVLVVRKPYN
jgi:hypothetical protein